MNARQHKKVMCNLVAKIVAKMTYPDIELTSTRSERKLFRRERDKVEWLVKETFAIERELKK